MVTTTDDLILIHPTIADTFTCPHCGRNPVAAASLLFQGIHILADCHCPHCQQRFYHTLAIGHDFLFPIALGHTGTPLCFDQKAWQWLVHPLYEALFNQAPLTPAIKKIAMTPRKAGMILLNCLDRRFGHSFTKLWNAPLLVQKYPDQSIILVLPMSMVWLVPPGVTEVWAVDAPFTQLDRMLASLNPFIQDEVKSFSSVTLSRCYTHLHPDKFDLSGILKTTPFSLPLFTAKPYTVTFILREDRFWHGHAVSFLLFKILKKLHGPLTLFCWWQNQRVKQAARHLKKKLPHVKINVAGVGKTGRFPKWITDQRLTNISAEDESAWCSLYAHSHIVIGVHGSNMLIPTALSAGFIEIMPRYKIQHQAEDIVMQYNSRYTLFLGRHVDQYASPALVALHAFRIISDFPYLQNNTEAIP